VRLGIPGGEISRSFGLSKVTTRRGVKVSGGKTNTPGGAKAGSTEGDLLAAALACCTKGGATKNRKKFLHTTSAPGLAEIGADNKSKEKHGGTKTGDGAKSSKTTPCLKLATSHSSPETKEERKNIEIAKPGRHRVIKGQQKRIEGSTSTNAPDVQPKKKWVWAERGRGGWENYHIAPLAIRTDKIRRRRL